MTNNMTDRAVWRLRIYPMAILLTLVAALLLATLLYDPDDPSSRLGGDYPAFYGAGSIVVAGDWDELYSPQRQQTEQAGLIDDDGGYLYFSYPPFVGAVYGLLATPGYQWSFLVHAALMVGALVGVLRLLSPWLNRTRLPTAALLVVVMAFYPVFRAVIGGQNTTLSLFLFAAAARLDYEDQPFLAGLVAAGLLFKPQFGVVVLPLLLVGRRWRSVAGWLVGALALFATSSLLMGGAWLASWWEQAGSFRELNVAANGDNFVSLPGFMENAFGGGWAVVLGYGLAALVAAGVAVIWMRAPTEMPLLRWGLAAAAAIVVAPQTLYYDVGLLLLALVFVLPLLGTKAAMGVGGLVLLSWSHLPASALGWSPLGPLGWAAVVVVLVIGWRSLSAGPETLVA